MNNLTGYYEVTENPYFRNGKTIPFIIHDRNVYSNSVEVSTQEHKNDAYRTVDTTYTRESVQAHIKSGLIKFKKIIN